MEDSKSGGNANSNMLFMRGRYESTTPISRNFNISLMRGEEQIGTPHLRTNSPHIGSTFPLGSRS
jgi:hypothetical protein